VRTTKAAYNIRQEKIMQFIRVFFAKKNRMPFLREIADTVGVSVPIYNLPWYQDVPRRKKSS
jgi:hypothetical protein